MADDTRLDPAVERRASKCFRIELDVTYRLWDRKVGAPQTGSGSTLNFSSRGLLFTDRGIFARWTAHGARRQLAGPIERGLSLEVCRTGPGASCRKRARRRHDQAVRIPHAPYEGMAHYTWLLAGGQGLDSLADVPPAARPHPPAPTRSGRRLVAHAQRARLLRYWGQVVLHVAPQRAAQN